ncbi:hypothetical protein ANSO36C_55510 [Nostoc cf. commune SO-36]|nr:hypothetical protein ANSO36C_55510 [Nostoc cf. commune SO-36]
MIARVHTIIFHIQLEGCDIIGDCCIQLEKLETESIMALTQLRKQEIISNYQVHETDTGSADVQVAMLTERINRLSEHLQANKKDHSSRRGLLKLIGQRKRLLAYISQESREKYQALIARLGIRG